LAERVCAAGASLELGATVTNVREVSGDGRTLAVRYERAGAEHEESFDAIVSTLPLRTTSTFVSFPQAFLGAYGGTDFLMARCLILALDRPLTGRYWVNVCDRGAPFMVVVEHTQLIGPEHYGGRHLVYLGNYAESFERLEASELVAQSAGFLRSLNAAFSLDWVTGSWQFVAANAQPVVTPGYPARIPPIETPIAGLYLASLEQVYPHDRGQNYAIELAEAVSVKVRARRAD
jgi:protoporphyrinogen oxidase